jgi:hypothetical protein
VVASSPVATWCPLDTLGSPAGYHAYDKTRISDPSQRLPARIAEVLRKAMADPAPGITEAQRAARRYLLYGYGRYGGNRSLRRVEGPVLG